MLFRHTQYLVAYDRKEIALKQAIFNWFSCTGKLYPPKRFVFWIPRCNGSISFDLKRIVGVLFCLLVNSLSSDAICGDMLPVKTLHSIVLLESLATGKQFKTFHGTGDSHGKTWDFAVPSR